MSDDTIWSLIDFTDPKDKQAGASAPASPVPVNTCPKCGKELGRGGHFHVRSCKGAEK